MTSPRYTVTFTPASARELRKLPADARERIVERVEALSTDPRPPGSKKLRGSDEWRVRIGDYRVLYVIEDERVVVVVVRVAHRREVYDR